MMLFSIITSVSASAQPSSQAEQKEDIFFDTVVEAYTYGYPLVLMDATKKVVTNVPVPDPKARAPINQFSHTESFPSPDDKDVVSPNADTLYSSAWLDLSEEPIVLQLPDTYGRYYLMPILDAWSNVIASPGKRTTGTQAGNYAIVGPNWQGELPEGVVEIKSPTEIAWIIGRTQTNGEEDYEIVHRLQAHYKLIPLSSWGTEYIPPNPVPVDPDQDMETPPMVQVDQMDAEIFFNTLAQLMVDNPPAEADSPIIKKMESIGIVAGQPFMLDDFSEIYEVKMKEAVFHAKQNIEAGIEGWNWENHWQLSPVLGDYGTDYINRATVAMYGLGANLKNDAIYPMVFKDANGEALTGRKNYVVHFSKESIPPVNAFWSLSLYDDEHSFVANELNRYALGDRDPLKYNEDGSLDIYIQHDSPGEDKESNWLPAAREHFNLIMRLYWPKNEVIDDEWNPPALISE